MLRIASLDVNDERLIWFGQNWVADWIAWRLGWAWSAWCTGTEPARLRSNDMSPFKHHVAVAIAITNYFLIYTVLSQQMPKKST